MRYARATVEFVFAYDDTVPAPVAATRIVHTLYQGDVVAITGGNLEPMTEPEVLQAMGACGECPTCQATVAEMVVPGFNEQADGDAVASENAAIMKAQGA